MSQIKDAMIRGLATRHLQPIGLFGVGSLKIEDPSKAPEPYLEIRQMNLNLNVKYDTGNEDKAKDMLMHAIYGETIGGLNEVKHLIANGLSNDAFNMIEKIQDSLR